MHEPLSLRRSTLPPAAAVVMTTLFSVACGGAEDRPPSEAVIESAPASVPTQADPCAQPSEGCGCQTVGAAADCRVYRRAGTFTSCEVGVIKCGLDLKWGVCILDGLD